MVSDISLYDDGVYSDSAALLPFVGAPFAYHAFRSGRSNWPTTLLSLGIGFGLTTSVLRLAGRGAGFTSMEWMLGQGLGAAGVRVGGRHYLMAMFAPRAVGLSWGIPTWVFIVGFYEWNKYLLDNPAQTFKWRSHWTAAKFE